MLILPCFGLGDPDHGITICPRDTKTRCPWWKPKIEKIDMARVPFSARDVGSCEKSPVNVEQDLMAGLNVEVGEKRTAES